MPRVVLLVTSPRLPAGLLTAEAWDLVRAYPVHAAPGSPQVAALEHAGVTLVPVQSDAAAPAIADALLAAAAAHGTAVWLAGPTGDEELARTVGLRLAREPQLAELELCYGSWDPAGARLLDAVAVMAKLIAPDGDPWKRSQTHGTLAPYLLEEAYEAYDAILAGDWDALREELGDVLLQVILHAGLAERTAAERAAAGRGAAARGREPAEAEPEPDEDEPDEDEPDEAEPGSGWGIDDVAAGLVDKLIRRNPHVFGDTVVGSLDEIVENWEQIKKAEKARGSALDGLAHWQPALAFAAKVVSRVRRAGLEVPPPAAPAELSDVDDPVALGEALLGLVSAVGERGLDAEAALRHAVLAYMQQVHRVEAQAATGSPPQAPQA